MVKMARGCWNFWEQEISTVEASGGQQQIRAFLLAEITLCWLCLALTAIVISRETVNTQQLPISPGWDLFFRVETMATSLSAASPIDMFIYSTP